MHRSSPFKRDAPAEQSPRVHREDPPLFGSWTAWYVLVIASLLFWIGVFYLFTRVFGK